MRASRKVACAGAALAAALVGLVVPSSIVSAAPKLSNASSPSIPGQYGSLPAYNSNASNGGTLTTAYPPGAAPTWIFPITPAANLSVYDNDDFENYSWRPLFWSPDGYSPAIDYSQSIAKPPVLTNDNKTVTITLNSGWKWSDGQPVTSDDVLFDYWLWRGAVKLSPANEGDYTPGLYPDNVTSITAPNPTTVVINFNRTYNADFLLLEQLGVLVPLPAQAWAETSASGPIIPVDQLNLSNSEAIYKFLAAQSADLKTYGTNPLWQVVDGPYKISSYDPATGANTMVINTAYTGPYKPHFAQIDQLAFTSYTAEFDQLLTGNVDFGPVDFSDLPQVPTLESKGYDVWGYPDYGFQYLLYNFKDKTGDFGNVISNLYVRQALAHLENEQALIKSRGVFDGAAGEAYGPAPGIPYSPFSPSDATKDPYPFSVSTAADILKSHGWHVVPNGTTTCVKPGTAQNECGPNIPKGTKMDWNLFYANQPPVTGTIDEVFASTAKQIGINLTLSAKTFNYLISDLNDVSSPKNDNDWAMSDFGGFTGYIYPTTNEIFNTTGSFNAGGFNNSLVNQAINNSIYSLNSNAVKAEDDLVSHEQPGLFQPEPDYIYAWKSDISGIPAGFEEASQEQYAPEEWWYVK